ncbi:alanine racemase [Mycobacterium hackensackense]|uniref:alanine racemase n=1 Tax=Mycobacterium hackensackense TaxID=228909 RepID=UPI00226597EC|nr:alanine racemase [Mycobacterium hackensackense]MCV7255814.1 alanine racemase [Mycobacterium hackensackense]
MFLQALQRRNPALIDAAIQLHQSGQLPPNTFVLDLDAITGNARALAEEAQRHHLTVFAMTKQIGRNPDACQAIIAGGIDAAVAVDIDCARATTRAGMKLGHVGHLVQIAGCDADQTAAMAPDFWTVFSDEKATEAARAAARHGRDQALLARIYAEGDEFYSGHEGGYPAEHILQVADRIDALDAAHFAGITTFPALLHDRATGSLRQTHNLRTLERAASALAGAGRTFQINGPGTTSAVALSQLAAAGITQVEPGHALTGSTPPHAHDFDLPEIPAVCYLTEVSHTYAGRAYCFGGGMYVDPVFPDYDMHAVVASAPDRQRLLPATVPPPSAIDYYGQIHGAGPTPAIGESVVFGFRVQAFVTRAHTAGVAGISTGKPVVQGIWSADGLHRALTSHTDADLPQNPTANP